MILQLLYLKKFNQNVALYDKILTVQCLLRSMHYGEHFKYIISLFPFNNPMRWELLCFPFKRWRNWGSERSVNSLKATELVGGRVRLQIQVWLHSWSSLHYLSFYFQSLQRSIIKDTRATNQLAFSQEKQSHLRVEPFWRIIAEPKMQSPARSMGTFPILTPILSYWFL